MLIAPFLSLRDALGQHSDCNWQGLTDCFKGLPSRSSKNIKMLRFTGATVSELMLSEIFCNKERIKGVKAGMFCCLILLRVLLL